MYRDIPIHRKRSECFVARFQLATALQHDEDSCWFDMRELESQRSLTIFQVEQREGSGFLYFDH